MFVCVERLCTDRLLASYFVLQTHACKKKRRKKKLAYLHKQKQTHESAYSKVEVMMISDGS